MSGWKTATDEMRAAARRAFETQHDVFPFWEVFDAKTQDDILQGRCIYKEHHGVPILDYSAKA